MKAIFNTDRGAAADTLVLKTIDAPKPATGEVLVAMKASGVNPSDSKLRIGAQGPMVAEQVLIHNDGAGVIEAVGEGVSTDRIGQRVWLYEINRANKGLGQGVNGTAAEYASVPAGLAAELPEPASFEEGACLGVPAMTAHRAVTCGGSVDGKTVLITGGAGAVGHSAIQIAKGLGATVITTVSSDEKAAIAKDAGADVIINYRTEDLQARILESAPDGLDHVADVDLAAHVDMYPAILKMNGTVGSYATASNLTPTIPFYPLAFRNIRIQPVFVYSMSDEAKAAAVADINDMLAKGQLKPRISKKFALEDVVASHELIESGSLVGNAVLTV
ncbi:MAG: NADPH:quinone reductase [Cognatishimia sp.]